MSLPIALLNFTTSTNAFTTWIRRIFNYNEPIGFAIYIILIFLFSFFYSFLQINPEKMAENLQKQNAYVPGVRPGEDTAIYFSRVLFKVTMLGATYLAISVFTNDHFNDFQITSYSSSWWNIYHDRCWGSY